MAEFKIGDKVCVVDEIYGHKFAIGEVVKIAKKYVNTDDGWDYICENTQGEYYYLTEEEFTTTPIEPEAEEVEYSDEQLLIFAYTMLRHAQSGQDNEPLKWLHGNMTMDLIAKRVAEFRNRKE